MLSVVGSISDRGKRISIVSAVIVVAAALQLLGVNPAASQSRSLVAYAAATGVDLDTDDDAWNQAPRVQVPLSAQQVVWPLGGSVSLVEVQSLHRDGVLYVRMEWNDATRNDDLAGVRSFVDAAAVEFPSVAETSVPALCMGQADNGVNIWQWRAGAENGRPSDITELSENGYVDRYPSTDELYFPALAAGNIVAEPHAVQDLVATGFGHLEAAEQQGLQGTAKWENDRWAVVFARELTEASDEKIEFGEGVTTDLAFAVWDGHEDERNGMKSVSVFVSLEIAGDFVTDIQAADSDLMLNLMISLAVLVVVGAGLTLMFNAGRKQ